MEIISDIPPLKKKLRAAQAAGRRVALVPTMGALHAGHLSLIQAAKARADVVLASIFVNPTQFGPGEDLERYPRDLEGDAAKLEQAGCDLVFTPTPALMYPAGFQTIVSVAEVTQGLCGASRPGHFDGVCTVVLKLFSIARPDVAVFGEKDYQQLAVLRRMAKDLDLDVEIFGAPLVREADGLALSSRNAYLSEAERAQALSLSAGLRAAKAAYEGGVRAAEALLEAARAPIRAAGLTPEYLELRDAEDLSPVAELSRPAVILVAVPVGATRLIDNIKLGC